MPKRFIFLWTIPLFFSTSLYAQPQDASPPAERTLWDHNGSIMYLIAIGSSRELHYQKPRPGMLEAGAHPDDVLFKGEINDGQISGTAYIFNAQCGQVPFHVKGPFLDNGGRIVLTGQAPRMARNCQTFGDHTSTLEFRLLKTSEVARPSPATAQAPNVEEPTREPPQATQRNPICPIIHPLNQPGRGKRHGLRTHGRRRLRVALWIPICMATYPLKQARRRNRILKAQSVPPTRKRLPLHQLSRRLQPRLPQPQKVLSTRIF